jgi:hypothetical protein
MTEFSFYSILCIMYRSEPVQNEEVFLGQECIIAARSALGLIPNLRTASVWQGHASTAYW